jgi:polyferredoxin
VLATLAFVTKKTALRWVSLATTFAVLGFVDGGFLSVSHITGVIWVGPSAILNDLPLLLMVTFTVVTVLLVGRVFCGFLCPFGALQDFLDRLVPARFKRELPRSAHRRALKAKYVVLALIVLPALAGIEASFYQYFEPFGTVFFLSTNAVLWTIAGSILVASAVVPRFYCRYACPLGAALALASVVSWKRIRRVEQCDHCKVCEQKCPTGAIEGPAIDFKECVRCNVCEVQLIERAGVCKHDMEVVRPRLVQLHARTSAGVAGSAA